MDNERRCIKCKHMHGLPKESPCLECIGLKHHPNYEPKPHKQVYISTADNRKNDLLDGARYAMTVKDMDVNSLYPWAIDSPFNSPYGVVQYIDKDVEITSDLLKRMEVEMEKEMREPKKVIFNDPATIVLWNDDTKTVVKCGDEPYDPEKGLAMAIAKKYLGNQGNYYNVFNKWLPEEETVIATHTEALGIASERAGQAANKLIEVMKKVTYGVDSRKGE